MPRINSPAELEQFRKELLSKTDPNKPCIALCSGSACNASASAEVALALEEEIEKQGLRGSVDLRRTGCHGFCEKGPIIDIHPEGICYFNVAPDDVPEIISETIKNKKVVERLLYTDPATNEKIVYESEIPFYKNQERRVFQNNSKIDPKNIDDYIGVGGYSALAKALSQSTPQQVVDMVKASGLRGRGGAGFSTGKKWEFARSTPGDIKYVIVNADEGDPGAYMDRSLLEGNPHAVLEGLTIGAYAIGSHQGYIYVRQEYPLAVKNVTIAIKQAEGYGFLGKTSLAQALISLLKCNREPARSSVARKRLCSRHSRGKGRRAKSETALSSRQGSVGQADKYK